MSQGTSIPNMDSVQLKTKELLTHHCSCHGNLVAIAARYLVDAYCPKKPPYQIWTQYDFRQELLTHHCCCHGNLVTIATKYVADAYCPKEPPYQIWTQYNLRQKSY